MVKNGRGQSGHGTKLGCLWHAGFLHAGTNSGKLKVDSVILGWAWSKMAVIF